MPNQTQQKVKLFGYDIFLDSNNVPISLDEKVIGVGFLPSHRLTFCPGASFFHTGQEKDVIWGTLYEIRCSTLEQLDEIQGFPTFYSRVKKKIHTNAGTFSGVWVYKAVEEFAKKNVMSADIRTVNLMSVTARKLKLPDDYQKFLDNLLTTLQ